MCLAVPVRVIDVEPDGCAEVEVGGVRSRVCLALLDGVNIADYLIVHAGFALTRLDVQEAEKTLALFAKITARLDTSSHALHP